ncbi:MAG TPA: DNA mismatch repair protein MutS, partial [Rhodanobacteraceae bacterium]
LSLARAAAVHLATVNRAFTLFATHYFELTELAAQFEHIANVHLDAVEYHDRKQGDQLVFMHAVKEGPANRSFGLQVAALAGLPKSVIAEARRTLAELEDGDPPRPSRNAAHDPGESKPQADLFARREPSAAERALADLDPDALTPREALEALYRLKALAN